MLPVLFTLFSLSAYATFGMTVLLGFVHGNQFSVAERLAGALLMSLTLATALTFGHLSSAFG
jgi:hypothetical protein